MWLHRLGAIFILASTLFYGLYAYFKLQQLAKDFHGPLGLTITTLTTFLFISGAIARKSLQTDQKNLKNAKQFHRVSILQLLLAIDFWLDTDTFRTNNNLFWNFKLFKVD